MALRYPLAIAVQGIRLTRSRGGRDLISLVRLRREVRRHVVRGRLEVIGRLHGARLSTASVLRLLPLRA